MADSQIRQPAAMREDVGAQSSQQAASGLIYRVADNLEDVVSAWEMVYQSYRRKDLISPSPHRLHTAPQAISHDTAVILGSLSSLTVTTLTAMADGPKGLPLDRVYEDELAKLRSQGRTLVEVGLFADRRKHLARTAEALFQLMRYAFFYGLERGMTDFVIGVHPRHARFYIRALGFDYLGAERVYPAVNDRPVVLLRGDIEARLKCNPLHPALDFFVKNPLDADVFRHRFEFKPLQIVGSSLEAFVDPASTAQCQAAFNEDDS